MPVLETPKADRAPVLHLGSRQAARDHYRKISFVRTIGALSTYVSQSTLPVRATAVSPATYVANGVVRDHSFRETLRRQKAHELTEILMTRRNTVRLSSVPSHLCTMQRRDGARCYEDVSWHVQVSQPSSRIFNLSSRTTFNISSLEKILNN